MSVKKGNKSNCMKIISINEFKNKDEVNRKKAYNEIIARTIAKSEKVSLTI